MIIQQNHSMTQNCLLCAVVLVYSHKVVMNSNFVMVRQITDMNAHYEVGMEISFFWIHKANIIDGIIKKPVNILKAQVNH